MLFSENLELQMGGVNYSEEKYQKLNKLMVGGLSEEKDIRDRVEYLQQTFNNFRHLPNDINDINDINDMKTHTSKFIKSKLKIEEDILSNKQKLSSELYNKYYKDNHNLEEFIGKLKEEFNSIREAIRLNFLSDDDIKNAILDANLRIKNHGGDCYDPWALNGPLDESFDNYGTHSCPAPSAETAALLAKEGYLDEIFSYIDTKIDENYFNLVNDCYFEILKCSNETPKRSNDKTPKRSNDKTPKRSNDKTPKRSNDEIPKRSNFTKAIETFINFAAYMLRKIKDLLEIGATSSVSAVALHHN